MLPPENHPADYRWDVVEGREVVSIFADGPIEHEVEMAAALLGAGAQAVELVRDGVLTDVYRAVA